MNASTAGPLMALGLLALVAGAVTRSGAADGEPRWITDYEAATAAAAQQKKPIFLVFR